VILSRLFVSINQFPDLLTIEKENKQHNGQKRRTNNTMAKREEQTQWPKEKNKQHNDQKRRNNTMAKRGEQTTQ
jgi:hypothetical protein